MFESFTTLQLAALLLAIFCFIAMAVQHFRYRSKKRRQATSQARVASAKESQV